jgi:3-isopropylmalate/(R)-2-methylmalate dehydratase small subunit
MMAIAEADPSTAFTVDLQSMRVTAAGQAFEIALPASAREAFLDGGWDATGLLVENYDDVRAVAARLPYVANSW